MARYDFSISVIVGNSLPVKKRKPKLINWLTALCSYIRSVHDDFLAKATEWDEDMKYAPGYKMQVQQMLIDKFGAGITITNNYEDLEPIYSYDDNDALNSYSFDDGDYSNGFTGDDDHFDVGFTNYTVSVPSTITFDQNEMEAVLNRYTRSGITYKIVIV